MSQILKTSVTETLGIKHPVLLAGMNVAAGPHLAAAVTNAGGLGVIGGVGYSPEMLREQIDELKKYLDDKKAPFGVDLLIPQVGGNARKTNHDYTKGKLSELVDIVIESGAKLFVSAVGVPTREVVERLHKAGVFYMNMIGHPKHVAKCLAIGVDIICAQGGEGGGHTGDIPTTILIPEVSRLLQNTKSELTGKPVQLIAAGGLYNGNSLAAALMLGASAVWIGTRFILSEEAGATQSHQDAVRTATHEDNIRTIIYTGRPMRVRKSDYIVDWEQNRTDKMKELTSQGIIPVEWDMENYEGDIDDDLIDQVTPNLMGKVAAVVNEKKPAREIVHDMVNEAARMLRQGNDYIVSQGRL